MFIVSTQLSLDTVWGLIDVFVGILVFVNVISLLFLFKSVKTVLNDFKAQRKEGKKPVWNRKENELYVDQGEYENFEV